MYSISGVLASGNRHRGLSNVKGLKRVSKASAITTACSGSSCSSSPAFDFEALPPFFALGGMSGASLRVRLFGIFHNKCLLCSRSRCVSFAP